MKTRLLSLLVLVVGCHASAFAALGVPTKPAEPTPHSFPVSEVRRMNGTKITRGATLMTVRQLLGPAQRQLSPTVWTYANYYPKVEAREERGCDTLVVTFSAGRVSDLRVVNASGARLIAANLSAVNGPVQIAKK